MWEDAAAAEKTPPRAENAPPAPGAAGNASPAIERGSIAAQYFAHSALVPSELLGRILLPRKRLFFGNSRTNQVFQINFTQSG